MNRIVLGLATLGLGVAALPTAASAAPWQSVNQRQANLDRRIDQGIRSGALNRNEAVRLRAEFRQIAKLEYRYRRSGGLSNWERRDLDQRFDRLSARVRYEKRDRQQRRW